MVKVYVDGVDMTSHGFPQGDNLQKEISDLVWWATGEGYVPGFSYYHRAPRKVTSPDSMVGGTMIGIKKKDGILFEVYI